MMDEKKDIVLVEKPETSVEQTEYSALSTEDAEFMRSFTEQERKRVVRKVSDIGNAKIEGLPQDLKLTGDQFNIATSIFFVGYVLLGKIMI